MARGFAAPMGAVVLRVLGVYRFDAEDAEVRKGDAEEKKVSKESNTETPMTRGRDGGSRFLGRTWSLRTSAARPLCGVCAPGG